MFWFAHSKRREKSGELVGTGISKFNLDAFTVEPPITNSMNHELHDFADKCAWL